MLAPDSKGVKATDSAGKLPRFAVIGTTDGGAHWVDQQLPPQ